MYQLIKRDTLYLDKNKGGIGNVNIEIKAVAILLNTFLKTIEHKSIGLSMTLYYCRIRASYLIVSDECKNVSFLSTPYYNVVIKELRLAIKYQASSNLNVRKLYRLRLPLINAKI